VWPLTIRLPSKRMFLLQPTATTTALCVWGSTLGGRKHASLGQILPTDSAVENGMAGSG